MEFDADDVEEEKRGRERDPSRAVRCDFLING
jgi:hypothetical protein